jgi:hypothetical protein
LEAMMRIDLGGSHIMLVWTENQYRNEIARLMQGITHTNIRLVRARTLLGLRLVVLRRTRPFRPTTPAGNTG